MAANFTVRQEEFYCGNRRGLSTFRFSLRPGQRFSFRITHRRKEKPKTQNMDFTELIDLASERLGGAVLYANDDFFAPKENLLKASTPVFIEGKYTDLGKWMDGWESRRRRTPGFDWCIIRLGLSGVIRGVVVDTSHFKGNYPEQCSIEACALDGLPSAEQLSSQSQEWIEILPKSNLNGDSINPFSVDSAERWTHLRFKIYPDGGVARLRVYGEVVPHWNRLKRIGSEVRCVISILSV